MQNIQIQLVLHSYKQHLICQLIVKRQTIKQNKEERKTDKHDAKKWTEQKNTVHGAHDPYGKWI